MTWGSKSYTGIKRQLPLLNQSIARVGCSADMQKFHSVSTRLSTGLVLEFRRELGDTVENCLNRAVVHQVTQIETYETRFVFVVTG